MIIKHPGEKNELWSPSNGWLKVVEEEFSSDLTKLRTVTVLMKNGEYKDFYGDGREFIDAPAPALFAEIPEFYKQFLPKEKKRYWSWKYKGTSGLWLRTSFYMDEHGQCSNGQLGIDSFDKMEKIKFENDFIEVDL